MSQGVEVETFSTKRSRVGQMHPRIFSGAQERLPPLAWICLSQRNGPT